MYSHNDLHQVTGIKDKGTNASIASFAYDTNGNMVSKTFEGKTTTLGYDALDRLNAVSISGQADKAETYAYDHGIRRIKKVVGSDVQQFHYSGPDIIAEYGSNWDTANAVYSHGAAIDDPLLRLAANDPRYYHGDGLGSITAVSNGKGEIVASNEYDHWGNITASTGTTPQFGYTGREPDATGLVYYRNRYYDPQIGRFTQLDPKGFIDGVNRYAYVMNSPVNYVDPWGLAADSYSPTLYAGGIYAEKSFMDEVFPTIRTQAEIDLARQNDFMNQGFSALPILPVEWAVDGIATGVNDGYQELSAGNVGGAVLAGMIGVGRANPARNALNAVDNYVDLTDFRKAHILNRHAPGAGKSGKSEFPSNWNESKILHEISDVATDPNSVVKPGRWGADKIHGTRDGVDIVVEMYPPNSKHFGKISTAYPENAPLNP
ncbi:RHS repeat-associated core domain-containing protein [Candidatus Sororendozoicomonas aggregata]|uniref:RHS repeat-associated core domain-containing protein n=1 Tax=Candidatus Sororendozoicomonas aggregata TaxID=3073239 RepID=UPI002ED0FEAD